MRTLEEIKEKSKMWNYECMFGILHSGLIKLPECGTCVVCFGYNEDGYEHVSVSPKKKFVLPSWNDMAVLNDIFFREEEESYQIMPKQSEYVNIKQNCLHLWRPSNGRLLRELI